MEIKINVFFKFKKGPWGGGNQFLKSLKKVFNDFGIYEENPKKADIILFNSHHELDKIILLKKKYREKIFVHRLAGPTTPMRYTDKYTDKIIYLFNELIADGTVFQSEWSRRQNYKLGLKKNKFETTIINAPDPSIFNREGKMPFSDNGKIRLIATSWSPNWNKGFDVYKWLDENLDFSKYEMTFIGNSPIIFKNIKQIKPLPPEELAKQLKQHDIYITASKNDSCSNALIEALHCGLPAIARNSGGHPEIIGKAGELFNEPEEIPDLIEKIVANYDYYVSNINLPTIHEVGHMYYKFMRNIYEKVENGEYTPKRIAYYNYFKLKSSIIYWKIHNLSCNLLKKLLKL